MLSTFILVSFRRGFDFPPLREGLYEEAGGGMFCKNVAIWVKCYDNVVFIIREEGGAYRL